MKKVAVLYSGNVRDRKGAINATLERIKYLSINSDFEIIPILLKNYGLFLTNKHAVDGNEIIDGKNTQIIAHYYSLLWYFICSKLFKRILFGKFLYRRIVNSFYDFDLIVSHSMECGYIANLVKEKYNIPYSVTWHGSDIHTTPFFNSYVRNITRKVIQNADINFFVSKKLLDISNEISNIGNKTVLYNGIDRERFKILPEDNIEFFRKEFCKTNADFNIAFVGNLVPIKNVLTLPKIFKSIKSKIPNITFHIVGDGPLYEKLSEEFNTLNISVLFHGNIPNELMPKVYNCLDLIVLPSINEGLPLVSAEAIACGCKFLGSRVGGIPEVVGFENTVELDSSFCENMSKKIIEILLDPNYLFPDISKFNWTTSALKEISNYNKIAKWV